MNEGTWEYAGKDGEKSMFRLRVTLSGDQAKERDHAIMEYLRGLCGDTPRVLGINPIGLTALWDSAFIAGVDHRAPPEPTALANTPTPKKKAKKKLSKKK